MIDDDPEKIYPFGINIYMHKGRLKTEMTEAVKSLVYEAFPDLDTHRDAVLTDRFARLLQLKAAFDNTDRFESLNYEFYEAIQESGNPDLMEMFTIQNVVIFHNSIRILTANTIDMLLETADCDERLALVTIMGRQKQREEDREQDLWEDDPILLDEPPRYLH